MNMSHELRTPLSLIIAPLEDMMKLSRMMDKKAATQLAIYLSKQPQIIAYH